MQNHSSTEQDMLQFAISSIHQELVPEYTQDEFALCFLLTALIALENQHAEASVMQRLQILYPDIRQAKKYYQFLRSQHCLDLRGQINLRGREMDLNLI